MGTEDLRLVTRVWVTLTDIILSETLQTHKRTPTVGLHFYKVQKMAKLICAVHSQGNCSPCVQEGFWGAGNVLFLSLGAGYTICSFVVNVLFV